MSAAYAKASAFSLLAVIAHPGDEIFNFGATLAHYASLGAQVTIACATRGEAGRAAENTDLGKVREGELRNACKALGVIEPIFLGFRDSGSVGTLSNDPAVLRHADPLEIEKRVREVIEQTKPHVILTFDPRGGNAHPDKRTIYTSTAAAFQFTGHLEQPPQRLFLVARPLVFMQRLAALPTGPWREVDPELYVSSNDTIAARVATQGQRARVEAARLAHASQPLSKIPTEIIDRVYSSALDEGTFALGGSRGSVLQWPLNDLFEGLI